MVAGKDQRQPIPELLTDTARSAYNIRFLEALSVDLLRSAFGPPAPTPTSRFKRIMLSLFGRRFVVKNTSTRWATCCTEYRGKVYIQGSYPLGAPGLLKWRRWGEK